MPHEQCWRVIFLTLIWLFLFCCLWQHTQASSDKIYEILKDYPALFLTIFPFYIFRQHWITVQFLNQGSEGSVYPSVSPQFHTGHFLSLECSAPAPKPAHTPRGPRKHTELRGCLLCKSTLDSLSRFRNSSLVLLRVSWKTIISFHR